MKYLTRCAAVGAIALVTLAGCQPTRRGATPAADGMTLQIYDVPADRTQAIAGTVNRALGGLASKLGGTGVTIAGPGKLLVYASPDTQSSIGKVIETLGKTTTQSVAPVKMNVHFWVVDGERGSGEDDPALKNLAGSLATLRQTMGPLHFKLEQASALEGTLDEDGSLTTANGPYQRYFSFRVASVNGDSVRLHLVYQDGGSSGLRQLDTSIDTTFGHYTVLAQAPGACPPPAAGLRIASCTDKPALRLLVVRVDRLPANA